MRAAGNSGSQKDLSWAERPRRELLKLTAPIAVSMLSFATMTVADTLFVSRLGTSALAGVGLGGMASFTIVCFGMGLLEGVKVRVSQAVGAGEGHRAAGYLRAGLAVALALSLLMIAAAWVVRDYLPLVAATSGAGQLARSYMGIRVLGAPFLLVYVAIREARYGQGDSRSPMVASIIANATNILLDYLFILVFEWGAVGAAWATSIAHSVEAGILLVRHRGIGMWPQRARWRDLRSIWEVGWPTGIQWWLEVGSFALLTALLSTLSERDMAAHQIALRFIHFGFLPVYALGEAASVLAGQAVGANRDALVHQVARHGYVLGLAYVLAYGAFVVVAGDASVWAFTEDPVLHDLAISLVWVTCGFLIADAANVVYRSVLRGAGDVRYAAAVGIGTAWACTPPLTWLLTRWVELGALGGWLAIALEVMVGAGLVVWRVRSGAWKRAAERSREVAERGSLPPAAPELAPG